jgi:hypothetical protein
LWTQNRGDCERNDRRNSTHDRPPDTTVQLAFAVEMSDNVS